ncbi:TDP-N-acetylfucosamine:lipid II N-acetylfucosaminyltransferase [Kineosporia mesophila]|uniref:TDP-N-acetylfucosamine:lipid II N-acetylfucosaminyltransferase n=1 Tax=Kineosporia mesophila TaxID=566012 RepID=UPI0038B22ED8
MPACNGSRPGSATATCRPARRQPGVGPLYLLLRQGVPVVLRREDGFTLDRARSGVPFLTDDWDEAALVRCHETLAGTRVEVTPFARAAGRGSGVRRCRPPHPRSRSTPGSRCSSWSPATSASRGPGCW